ncbi:MAG: hypothetical protein JXB26_17870 [Candidatus Aminicenantes bacterium]|nr:hypothetical protein [Candidatus Aminicenantes bacterium]
MRTIAWILVLAAIGFAAYMLFFSPKTEEEQAVIELEKRFDDASNRLIGAERSSGISGLDTTSDAQNAVVAIKKVYRELKTLIDSLAEDKALRKAEDLEARVLDFMRKYEIE